MRHTQSNQAQDLGHKGCRETTKDVTVQKELLIISFWQEQASVRPVTIVT